MKTKFILPVLTILVLGGAVLGVTRVAAEDSTRKYPPIIDKLVQRFGLNVDEVKAVFDTERTERQVENKTRFEEHLAQAVTDGKLTEAQKQLVLQKHEEMQSQRQAEIDSMRDLTPEQRREKMKERQAEMKAWAEQNNIDVDLIMGGKGMRGGFRMGR
jgi:hypothetical protein